MSTDTAGSIPQPESTPPSTPTGGEVVELDAEKFGSVIPDHPFAILDFWAPWCAPCRAFAPVFTEAAKRHPEILFAKVNTEDEQALAGHFNIRSIPTLMVFRENVIIFSQPGALSAGALEQVIMAARELDMTAVHREMAESAAKGGEEQAGQ